MKKRHLKKSATKPDAALNAAPGELDELNIDAVEDPAVLRAYVTAVRQQQRALQSERDELKAQTESLQAERDKLATQTMVSPSY